MRVSHKLEYQRGDHIVKIEHYRYNHGRANHRTVIARITVSRRDGSTIDSRVIRNGEDADTIFKNYLREYIHGHAS